jgi:acetoacetyl-CoA synthetase
MWTHGDLIDIAADGSTRFHGRSDGVLNIDGIRIGPTEIYTILKRLPEIGATMAVEQRDPTRPGSSRLVLLLVLRAGRSLDDELAERIRALLREEAHVPSVVVAVPDLPTTFNGKPSERAVRDVLNGEPPRNIAALRNPESLQRIADSVEAATRPPAAPPDGEGTDGVIGRLFFEVLGRRVRDTADFFDSGGTSRQSMTLLRLIRTETGRDVSMETFLADPSIRALTDALERSPATAPHDVAVRRLRQGTDPTATPLLLLQGVHGDVDLYRYLVEQLDAERAVHGAYGAMYGRDGERVPVHEVAARLVEGIAAVMPVGPIALAGYSFGGLLAYEAARLLVERGRDVVFLGLLDSRPPLASLTRPEQLARKAASFIAIFLPGFSDTTIASAVANRFRRQTLSSEQLMLLDSVRLARSFRLKPYGGPVTYFRAARRIPVISHLMHAWRRMAPDLTVVDVPGAHFGLLSEENAPALAARMSDALRAADEARAAQLVERRAG